MRKRGIKVILNILGNHDQAGVARLSNMGAREFAKELAAYCRAYNLDGVGFDDEYAGALPDPNNPWFARVGGPEAASRLLYETKKALPDKTVMVYYYGTIAPSTLVSVDGVKPGQYIDYVVDDYGGTARPADGMTLRNCSAYSVELNRSDGSDVTVESTQAFKDAGYGYYMLFGMNANNALQDAVCRKVCKGLYGEDLLSPTHYYKKNDTTRYKK